MRVVLDTNVLVSGLLNAAAAPGRILDLLTLKRIIVLYDDRVFAEYRQVLQRARFAFAPADVRALLDFIHHEGELVVNEPLGVELPDPDDSPFLEVAVAATADGLITGNARHFPAKVARGAYICTPTAFITRWLT